MTSNINRDLGRQPIADILNELDIKPKDLVNGSTDQLTFKMISRACKGRRLTRRVQLKLLLVLNKVSAQTFSLGDVFNY